MAAPDDERREDERAADTPGAGFVERHVEADGFRIRYLDAGAGPPLIHLHGAGGLGLGRAHDLLAERFRVIAFEVPGFSAAPANERSGSMAELARTMAQAAAALGLGRYSLMGTSFGGTLALWLAVQHPDRLDALVLESPTAIRPDGDARPDPPPEQLAGLLYAHPERQPPIRLDPAVLAKQTALVARLRGPDRDTDLEGRLGALHVPTLLLFGTLDRMIPASMGRVYRDRLANGHLVLVYDAGHAIAADRPEAFSRLVGDFLERREQFVVSRVSGLLHP
jgi:pimeloyl-ACP methyl ester carboxylesterase